MTEVAAAALQLPRRRGRRARQTRGPEQGDPRLRRVAPPAPAGADSRRSLRAGGAVAISIRERDLRTALTGAGGLNAVLDVVVEGGKAHSVGAQGLPARQGSRQRHARRPAGSPPRPADPRDGAVHLIGESVGAKEGGVLTQVLTELNVEALPMEVPASPRLRRLRDPSRRVRAPLAGRAARGRHAARRRGDRVRRPSRSRRARRSPRPKRCPRAKRAPRARPPRASEPTAEGDGARTSRRRRGVGRAAAPVAAPPRHLVRPARRRPRQPRPRVRAQPAQRRLARRRRARAAP